MNAVGYHGKLSYCAKSPPVLFSIQPLSDSWPGLSLNEDPSRLAPANLSQVNVTDLYVSGVLTSPSSNISPWSLLWVSEERLLHASDFVLTRVCLFRPVTQSLVVSGKTSKVDLGSLQGASNRGILSGFRH